MIIDFHTHIFPDALAPRARKSLIENTGNLYTTVTDMTLSGLLEFMDEWNIDISVTQPVVTKQSQTVNTNEWAASTASNRIVPFGGLYPHTDDYKRDIDLITSLGLKGIKFHPEYQNFIVDDSEMLKLYDYALSKGLILLFHAGEDAGMPAPYKSSPKQFAHIIDELKGGIIVAAHFGGHAQWDDVERYLTGKNIYLDTSMGFEYFCHEQFVRIVRAHGADKVLFASDSPWSHAGYEVEALRSQPLTINEIDDILYRNALRLLKL